MGGGATPIGSSRYFAKYGNGTYLELSGTWSQALHQFVCRCIDGTYPKDKFTHVMVQDPYENRKLYQYISVIDGEAYPWVHHNLETTFSYQCRPDTFTPRAIELLGYPAKFDSELECPDT